MWRHSVSERDARTIVNAGIPVLVLHGRHDIVAAPRYGEALARRCAALCAACGSQGWWRGPCSNIVLVMQAQLDACHVGALSCPRNPGKAFILRRAKLATAAGWRRRA